jgi:hypothetical protein
MPPLCDQQDSDVQGRDISRPYTTWLGHCVLNRLMSSRAVGLLCQPFLPIFVGGTFTARPDRDAINSGVGRFTDPLAGPEGSAWC